MVVFSRFGRAIRDFVDRSPTTQDPVRVILLCPNFGTLRDRGQTG